MAITYETMYQELDGFGVGYVYSHDAPDIKQQFLPDELKDKKYLN